MLALILLLRDSLPVPPSPVAFDQDKRLLVTMFVKDDMVALLDQCVILYDWMRSCNGFHRSEGSGVPPPTAAAAAATAAGLAKGATAEATSS